MCVITLPLAFSGIFFPDPSCLGSAQIVSKEEIKPIEYVLFKSLHPSIEPRTVSVEELAKPDFNTPFFGFPDAMQIANRIQDWSLYYELSTRILKIQMTDCLPEASLTLLMLERTKGNCFNSAMRFFRSNMDPAEIDERDITSFLETDCKETKVNQKPFGLVGTFSNEVFLVHAFIYNGDGWILTKNGVIPHRPLQFQRLSDTKQIYAPWVNRETQYFDCRVH